MSYSPQFEKEYEGGWEDFPSEDTLITAHALNMFDGTFEHIEDYLEDHPIAQTTTMPTASEDELGNIYQYMGATDANYTQGYFYKCMDDGEEPPLYFWARINVQPGGGGGGGALEDLDDVNITSPTDGQALVYDDVNDKWVNGTINNDAELTNDYWNSATSYVVGDIVIYLNALYKCKVANTGQTPTDTTYWEATSLSELGKVVFMSKSMTSNAYGYFSGFEDKDGNVITRDKYVLFDISSEESGAYYFGMVFEVTGSGIIVKMANQNLQAVTASKTLTVKYSYIKR